MLSIMYDLIFTPIELVVELTYGIMFLIFHNYGLSIIAVSLVIQTLILPLYLKADEIQEREKKRQEGMAYWVKHIKRTFSGDEKYMMLSAYYRQCNYKTWYALGSSISILLQIPFFVAAYHYLSNLSDLKGNGFWFIQDLGKPDMLIQIYGYHFNLLPILMTLVNILSGMVYSRKSNIREKFQIAILAVFFLILLYNSPSGLVLYWTTNNIYSLVKNIFQSIIGRKQISVSDQTEIYVKQKQGQHIYWCMALFLSVFIGGVISANAVSSSPTEFVNYSYGPIYLVCSNIAVFSGIFLLWGTILYELMSEKNKCRFEFLLTLFAGLACLNYFFFGKKIGRMSALFVYDEGLFFSGQEKLVNAIVIILVGCIIAYIFIKHKSWIKKAGIIMTISALGICMINMVSTTKQLQKTKRITENIVAQSDQIFKVSKTGKNVIVIFLDRAISGFVPFIMEEKPELAECFQGFTWYSNTLSFGQSTNFAAPSIYGGYEYTPREMNKREEESLKEKHNEALKVTPVIFSNEGYDVVVCDPPYAGNYEWTADVSIYDSYENIDAYITEGAFSNQYFEQYAPSYKNKQKRALTYYSLMKALPVSLQKYCYRSGQYWSKSQMAIKKSFFDWYSVLLNLRNMTTITDEGNNFIEIQNSMTHEGTLLKLPEYVPDENLNIEEDDRMEKYYSQDRTIEGRTLQITDEYSATHYEANMAAFIQLSEWFSYLRNNNCWDNTRIIIVSDHGMGLANFQDMILDQGIDVEHYNPLLLVKDFYSNKELTEDKTFMTTADVPYLSMKDLVSNPENPFTGKAIKGCSDSEKQYITTSTNWDTTKNNGNVFDTTDGKWYIVSPGSIFDESNWTECNE